MNDDGQPETDRGHYMPLEMFNALDHDNAQLVLPDEKILKIHEEFLKSFNPGGAHAAAE